MTARLGHEEWGSGATPLHPEGAATTSWSGCGSRETSWNAPGTSRLATRQVSRLGLPPSGLHGGAAAFFILVSDLIFDIFASG